MTKKNYTHIAIVLDQSGSMAHTRDETIRGFNLFVDEQRRLPGEATLSLCRFASEVQPLAAHALGPIGDTRLTPGNYRPNGSTALYDAIGMTTRSLGAMLASMAEGQRPDKVIVATLTDGLENASRTYTASDISAMIEHQTRVYGWTFVYIGANQDAILQAGRIGIRARNAINYVESKSGKLAAMRAMSKGVSGLRGGARRASAVFDAKDAETSLRESGSAEPELF